MIRGNLVERSNFGRSIRTSGRPKVACKAPPRGYPLREKRRKGCPFRFGSEPIRKPPRHPHRLRETRQNTRYPIAESQGFVPGPVAARPRVCLMRSTSSELAHFSSTSLANWRGTEQTSRRRSSLVIFAQET